MSAPLLIGLTGKARAGKDTAAAHMAMHHAFARVAFADPIRRAVSMLFGLAPSMFQHPHKEEALGLIGKSPRELMQTLGTEWGRNLVHPDVWLILARELILTDMSTGGSVVVTDVRFENEATMIRDLGGQIWHIDRDGAGTTHAHVSEAGVAFNAMRDVRIVNNDSITSLQAQIDKVLA